MNRQLPYIFSSKTMINRIIFSFTAFLSCFIPIWFLYNVIVKALHLTNTPLLHGFRLFLTLIGTGIGLIMIQQIKKGTHDSTSNLMIIATYVAGVSGLETVFKIWNLT